jgi:hypothetical protein
MEKKDQPKGTIFRHKDYLVAIADKLWSTVPAKAIVFNTLFDIFKTGATEGYLLRVEQSRKFKEKREEHRKRSWNMVKDNIDGLIHEKTPQA